LDTLALHVGRFDGGATSTTTLVGNMSSSAIATLVARFQRMPQPEWLLLASLVLDDRRGAMRRYLGAVRNGTAENGQSSPAEAEPAV
jgi:hypothetical protein